MECNGSPVSSSIAVITKGKYSVLEAGSLAHLIALLSDSTSEVRTNAVKVGVHALVHTYCRTCQPLQCMC